MKKPTDGIWWWKESLKIKKNLARGNQSLHNTHVDVGETTDCVKPAFKQMNERNVT